MSLNTLCIVAITVIAVLVTIDTVKYIKAKNMVENAIDNCLKAIKEKEVK